MKSQNMVMTRITIQPNGVEKERSKSASIPAEIRLRVIEMHVQRGGTHRLALDTWQQAHNNSEKGSKTGKEKQQSNGMGHRDDIEIRERSTTVKSPSLVGWYHILRAHHHWRVFQAIRYALWLCR
jgi:hypothetical protein